MLTAITETPTGKAQEVLGDEIPEWIQGYNEMELLAMEFGAEMVDKVIIRVIVDEATFNADCAVIWAECMSVETASGGEELSEFERRLRKQYHDLIHELEELPPTCLTGGF